MLMERYVEAVEALYKKVIDTQKENILKAACLIVEAVREGGSVHIYDTGHIVNSELTNRAGGLALLKPLHYSFTVDNQVRARDQTGKDKSMEGLARYVIRQSGMLPGDVLILGSVSGKTANVIDLALEAKKIEVKIITICSIEYSSTLAADHSSGKHLYELGDLSLDNCAPVGDAMLEVEGLENQFGPASGLSSAFMMWCISARVVEKMLEEGLTPTVYKSVNYANGRQALDMSIKRYNDTGI